MRIYIKSQLSGVLFALFALVISTQSFANNNYVMNSWVWSDAGVNNHSSVICLDGYQYLHIVSTNGQAISSSTVQILFDNMGVSLPLKCDYTHDRKRLKP